MAVAAVRCAFCDKPDGGLLRDMGRGGPWCALKGAAFLSLSLPARGCRCLPAGRMAYISPTK